MSPEAEETIRSIRAEIDGHDQAIVQLIQATATVLQRRADCAERIGLVKRAERLPIKDLERELRVTEHVKAVAGMGPLPAEDIVSVFRKIIEVSTSVQFSKVLI